MHLRSLFLNWKRGIGAAVHRHATGSDSRSDGG
ncbi:hypothetical protein PSCT_03907 [Pseudomonas sp. SCT]|jgi:hypothetical protein|nr:hypothetical protein PSCT_03907 [Pseudomonas sp. SCT]